MSVAIQVILFLWFQLRELWRRGSSPSAGSESWWDNQM